ncbi:MAG: DUF4250 domain-containing protein [Acutalibacteraceae bacterium]
MNLPKDPFMLLSYINTKLRDDYGSLDELCKSLCVEKETIVKALEKIDCHYDVQTNSFC